MTEKDISTPKDRDALVAFIQRSGATEAEIHVVLSRIEEAGLCIVPREPTEAMIKEMRFYNSYSETVSTLRTAIKAGAL